MDNVPQDGGGCAGFQSALGAMCQCADHAKQRTCVLLAQSDTRLHSSLRLPRTTPSHTALALLTQTLPSTWQVRHF